jgi:hypothetical protein
MIDIYQQIWDADQASAGVQPILDTMTGDPQTGFVKVNSNLNEQDQDLRVLPEAVIPDSKSYTYDLCRRLFDNYALSERDVEFETPEEREEVHNLVQAMVDTAPMEVAREYVAQATGTSLSRERWYNTLMEMWFRRFSMGGDPHLSGFEHVVVGEQEGGKAQGYHFWYKYYLDDGFARQVDGSVGNFPGLTDDRILYLGSRQEDDQAQFPQCVTISYRWDAPDYDREQIRPLTKPIGGFFVGCSVEGLLAMGTVRAHIGARAPKEAVIDGARYELKVYRSQNNLHVRTFYPVFLRADRPDGEANVRIIAALINPEGHDPGKETVTLINIGTTQVSLEGWRIEDRNRKTQPLSGVTLGAGETVRIFLDPAGAQLSNKGGHISLIDLGGQVVHTVTYPREHARVEGETILF